MHYASFSDDIVLTIKALKILITICEIYAAVFDIKFNGTKSKHMVFKSRNCDIFKVNIYVNLDFVTRVTSTEHLGHLISLVFNTSMIQAADGHFRKGFNLG